MHIVKVIARNVKGVSFVEVTPKKTTTVIGGNNRAGKSSFLDAIAYTLGGQKLCPLQPIKRGQKEAECSVELDGDPARMLHPCVVTRKWWLTPKGDTKTELEITTKEGYRAPTPQQILDDVCGKLGFDPEKFLRMKPADQVAVLRELVHLDFSELDAEYKRVYEERAVINKQGVQAKAKFESAKLHQDVGDKPVSVSELMDELRKRQAVNQANSQEQREFDRIIRKRNDAMEAVGARKDAVKAAEEALRKAEAALAGAEATAEEYARSVELARAKIGLLEDADTQSIEQQISQSEEVNRKVRENAQRAELEVMAKKLRADSQAKTDRLKAIEEEKERLTSEAKWPVPGLGFSTDGVTYNGLPFEQASSREQREVAVAISCELSPSLKFGFVKDGSLLDDEGLAEIAEIAAKRGVQLFVERVGEGDECNIVIADGMVVRSDAQTPEEVTAT